MSHHRCLLALSFAATLSAADPVVVELFTSEGCSSCPPADRVCRELAERDPDLILLGWHVTYWDDLGWREPYGLAAAEFRQRGHAQRLAAQVYTPQAIVGGEHSVLGSDQSGLLQAIAEQRTTGVVRLQVSGQWTDRSAEIIVTGPSDPQGDLLVAVVEDDLQSQVDAGENRGRTLRHARVVRGWTEATMGQATRVALPNTIDQTRCWAVAFTTNADGRVTAAGQSRLRE